MTSGPPPPFRAALDHLVYAVVDLDAAVDHVEAVLGVRPSPGGRHVGRGTRNHLLSFGRGSYLEVIGADPDQPAPDGARPFGVDDLTGPRLVTWAVSVPDIDAAIAAARAAGYDPGPAQAMSRATPDGGLLTWRLTEALVAGDGLVPFLIEWGDTVHPSVTATGGARLLELRGVHPDPGGVAHALRALGLLRGPKPLIELGGGTIARLTARIAGPTGTVTLG